MSLKRLTAVAISVVMALSVGVATDAGAATRGKPDPKASQPSPREHPSTVDPRQRDQILFKGWRQSSDFVWTSRGDATGFHLLAAEARTGYAWRTVATLAEPGLQADRWIGNACVTESGKRAVVVYAPRTFTNKAELARRGGFTAVVDLKSGAVRKLPVTTSLSYFNPGCGAGEAAVLTQEGDEDLGATRLTRLDTASGRLGRVSKVKRQVTSAIPTGGGIVAAAGHSVAQIDRGGKVETSAMTANTPFDLLVDDQGGVNYLDRLDTQVRVQRTVGKNTKTLAEGALGKVGLAHGTEGRVFLTGSPQKVATLPEPVRRLNVPVNAAISSQGQLAVTHVDSKNPQRRRVGAPADRDVPELVQLRASVTATGRTVDFTVAPGLRASRRYREGTVPGRLYGVRPRRSKRQAGSSTNPVDDDRTCSVPRNDYKAQAYQPTPRQTEWAADLAVKKALTVSRPAGFKEFGLPAYSPQGMFPPGELLGGGEVAPQVFLGILAQESNLWQASRYSASGEFGNPLTGNFYGLKLDDETGEIKDWIIHWADSDCGYGISQMTSGMRRADTTFTKDQQRAIGLDYAANIAAGMRLLQNKWNQLYNAGIGLNNGDSSKIENWFFAAWAYNSGFYPKGNTDPDAHGAWGLGWFNNPVNPRYKQDRKPFLHNNSWSDAAHPQDWPYPEKIMGFAGWSIDTPDGPGFRPAWWNGNAERQNVKPPINQFCDSSNECEPGKQYPPTYPDVVGQKPGPCAHKYNGQYDLRCYYHQGNTWKEECNATCGNSWTRFDPGYPEPDDGSHFPPSCNQQATLPAGALVIDDIPGGTPVYRCGRDKTKSAGTFHFNFNPENVNSGTYSSKIDFHQLGGGNGGHFWFAHSRRPGDYGDRMAVEGSWKLDRQINGWARVMVHMPDHGAHTRHATYRLNDKLNSRRVLPQRTQAHKWVSLGAFQFDGVPRISLSNVTPDGRGAEDVAWDAIAVQPLPGKPKNVVVALGDSYSSGEGASYKSDPSDYYKETDVDGKDGEPWRNACHRSPHAWSRQAKLPGTAHETGYLADTWSQNMDYRMAACSGARAQHLLSASGDATDAWGKKGARQHGELAQLDQGHLDENTTLVTVSIGGNDARFSDIVKHCLLNFNLPCYEYKMGDDDEILKVFEEKLIKTKVRQSIETTVKQIHQKAKNAKIILMGYPRLLENGADCITGLGDNEAKWMNKTTDLMAEQMKLAAENTDAVYADPRTHFDGKGICGSPETIHGIVLDLTPGDPKLPPSMQSFHPKVEGARLYANALEASLRIGRR